MKIFNYRVWVVFGYLFLATLTISSATEECEGCVGETIVQLADKIEQYRLCWFTNQNHYLTKFKVQILETIGEFLGKLSQDSNALVNVDCKTHAQLKACTPVNDDMDTLSECFMANIKSLAYNYRSLETCHKKVLPSSLSDLTRKIMQGTVDATKQLHPNCVHLD